MNKLFLLLALFLCGLYSGVNAQSADSLILRKIYSYVLENGKGYAWLEHLSNKIGGRLSGSPEAAAAVDYMKQVADSLGADTVYLQEVMVPHWVRGKKEELLIINKKSRPSEAVYNLGSGISSGMPAVSAKVVNKSKSSLSICALGGSIGTGKSGVRARVVMVRNYQELDSLGEAGIKGKIVFYNVPMDQKHILTFHAYGEKGTYRYSGPSKAAKYGAVASITRSLTLAYDDNPHTGAMKYDTAYQKIPCCAISTVGAAELEEELRRDPNLELQLKLSCETLPDVKSYNIIAELKGSEFPDEYVIAGGHLDAWDNGDGAHDDGAGCVQVLEMIRVMKALGIRPKRTLRAVLFMNEENGLRGGKKYAEEAATKKENHIAAIESDAGGFTPNGWMSEGSEAAKRKLRSYETLFLPYGIYDFSFNGGGADIDPLKTGGTFLVGLLPDTQRYFDYHHTSIDTFDKVNRRELLLGTAAITSLAYLFTQYGAE